MNNGELKNPDQLKEKILDLDIVEVISKYVDLKKSGTNFKGSSPFTNEKTPSFFVSPVKQIFKCFSSGIGGNAITFVMEHEKLNFREACKLIARDHNLQYQEKEYSKEEKEAEHKREQLEIVNNIATTFFAQNLKDDALTYAKSRFSDDTINFWGIGYAPDNWNELQRFMATKGFKSNLLLDAGLLKKNNEGKIYDTFRGRLMFPIHDKYGRIVGFTGRIIPFVAELVKNREKDIAKYLNTAENILFRKGKILFGLDKAYKSIREKGFAYLVEGQPDVIKLHQLDIHNTVCTGGTALTDDHIRILKSYCESITIIPDMDSAGLKALKRSAEMMIKEGLKVNVIILPSKDDGSKHDADSFFTDTDQFNEYAKSNIIDYIFYRGNELKKNFNKPDLKISAINEICKLVVCFSDPVLQDIYADGLGDIMPPRKSWKDKLKMLQKDQAKKSELPAIHQRKNGSPINKNAPGISNTKSIRKDNDQDPTLTPIERDSEDPEEDFSTYRYFKQDGTYYTYEFKGKFKYPVRQSNFLMEILFHFIDGTNNTKRLLKLQRYTGEIKTIEVLSSETKIEPFETILKSHNCTFLGTSYILKSIFMHLMDHQREAHALNVFGYNQEFDIYTFSDCILNNQNQIIRVNNIGILTDKEKYYYLPAWSNSNIENKAFTNERKFRYKEGKLIFEQWAELIYKAYGVKGSIGICFLIYDCQERLT